MADRDTYLLSGLRNKRELIAGRIVELEKEAAQLREDLGHVEAVLRICQPGVKLPRVMPRKLDYRAKWFANGELSRHCRDYLREAGDQLASADDIARAAMRKKGIANHNATRIRIIQTVLFALNRLGQKGTVQKIGLGKGARWKLAQLDGSSACIE
jgi:hypothetical protein